MSKHLLNKQNNIEGPEVQNENSVPKNEWVLMLWICGNALANKLATN